MSGSEIAEVLSHATERLRAVGVESPRREARLLLAHSLGIRPEAFVSGNIPSPNTEAWGRFQTALERRASREPLAYILGRREFWSLDFEVGPGVLIPRPESEIMVEQALKRFPIRDAPLRVMDLGTGSGCLLLAFLSERPKADGVGVDISREALGIAKRNAENLGLGSRTWFVRGDWMSALSGTWDVIFVNPPYIVQGELAGLDPEVSCYEPRAALDGGPDGLCAYRRIAAALFPRLGPQGRVFLEVGQGRASDVESILAEKGLSVEGTVLDLACIPRCLVVVASAARITAKKELAIGTRSS
jgi:release factor glutamine methyltransferase